MKYQSCRSLLQYPGGKGRIRERVRKHFPDTDRLLSPFFGAGHIEIDMAAEGTKVVGCDAWFDLINFWQHALSEPETMADYIRANIWPVDRDLYYEIRERYRSQTATQFERACFYYALNRTSAFGFLGTGYTIHSNKSHWGCNFGRGKIQNLRVFYAPNLEVFHMDFRESLKAFDDGIFTYCDPPYYGDTTVGNRTEFTYKDHIDLFRILRERPNWALSYNDIPFIRRLYSDFRIETIRTRGRTIGTNYAKGRATASSKKTELLILNT